MIAGCGADLFINICLTILGYNLFSFPSPFPPPSLFSPIGDIKALRLFSTPQRIYSTPLEPSPTPLTNFTSWQRSKLPSAVPPNQTLETPFTPPLLYFSIAAVSLPFANLRSLSQIFPRPHPRLLPRIRVFRPSRSSRCAWGSVETRAGGV